MTDSPPLQPDGTAACLVPLADAVRMDAVVRSLSDNELLRRLSDLLRQSRRVEAELVAHIGEVDERQLYRREAAPSMFVYCTDVLHLSEPEAYLRITVARAARAHPMLLPMLADGRLHLSGIAKLAPYLASAHGEQLLERATYQSKREIEVLVSEIAPRQDVSSLIRKLPDPRPSQSLGTGPEDTAACAIESMNPLGPDGVGPGTPVASRPSVVLQPLTPDRYKVQFTATAAFREKLERLKALMRSSASGGDLASILEQAVTEKLERLEAKRFGRTKSPRPKPAASDDAPSSRYLPAAVRRAVHERDGGRCRFVGRAGRRCRAREGLDFHHVHPWALGGDRSVANLRLMCRAHNAFAAEHDFGVARMSKNRNATRAPP